MRIVDVSVIIPTLNRRNVLVKTLESISFQSVQPSEIIIVDGSDSFAALSSRTFDELLSKIIHVKADRKGAAVQRNQGISLASSSIVGFFDDDILLEPACFDNLYNGMATIPDCGGINAVITNQSYHPLGKVSKTVYWLITGEKFTTYAGKCIGPLIAFLPENKDGENKYLQVDWLNTTCTLYRKEALPNPVFDSHFTGYSLMEDLELSLSVKKNWKLYNASAAKIYHDSQPHYEKNNIRIYSEMDLVNRYYILKKTLGFVSSKVKIQLFLQQLFSGIASRKITNAQFWEGKIEGLKKIEHLR